MEIKIGRVSLLFKSDAYKVETYSVFFKKYFISTELLPFLELKDCT